jgi:hypothetical protein
VAELVLDDDWTDLKTDKTDQAEVDIDAQMNKEEVKMDDDGSEEEIDIDAQLASMQAGDTGGAAPSNNIFEGMTVDEG